MTRVVASCGLATVTVNQWMLKVGALRNGFTYGKLFHQLVRGNSFRTFAVTKLLMRYGKYLRTLTKVYSQRNFFSNLETIDVLIELCPMVPFVAKVPHGVTVSTFAYEGWITLTVAEPSTLPVFL